MTFLIFEILAYLVGAALLGGFVVYSATTRSRQRDAAASEAELKALEEEVGSLQSRLEALQQGRRDQEARYLKLETKHNQVQRELDLAHRERDEHRVTLAAVVGSHESDLAELRSAHARSEERLQAELAQAHAQITTLRADKAAVTEQLGEQRAEATTHRLASEVQRQELANLHAELEQLRAAPVTSGLKDQVAELEARLGELHDARERDRERHEDAVRASQVALREQDAAVQGLRASKEQLEAQLSQTRGEHAAALGLAEAAQAELDDLRHRSTAALRQQAGLEADVVRLTREAATARDHAKELELEVQRLREQPAPVAVPLPAPLETPAPPWAERSREREAELRQERDRLVEELAAARVQVAQLQTAVQANEPTAVALEAAEQRRADLERGESSDPEVRSGADPDRDHSQPTSDLCSAPLRSDQLLLRNLRSHLSSPLRRLSHPSLVRPPERVGQAHRLCELVHAGNAFLATAHAGGADPPEPCLRANGQRRLRRCDATRRLPESAWHGRAARRPASGGHR